MDEANVMGATVKGNCDGATVSDKSNGNQEKGKKRGKITGVARSIRKIGWWEANARKQS